MFPFMSYPIMLDASGSLIELLCSMCLSICFSSCLVTAFSKSALLSRTSNTNKCNLKMSEPLMQVRSLLTCIGGEIIMDC